jgi:hypothetical protein
MAKPSMLQNHKNDFFNKGKYQTLILIKPTFLYHSGLVEQSFFMTVVYV